DGKPGSQTRVCVKKALHFLGVTCQDDYQLFCVVFHPFDQTIDTLFAEILLAASSQRIGFVYKEDAPQGLAGVIPGLLGGMADVLPHKISPFDFNYMPLGQKPCFKQQFAEYPCDGGLPGAWITLENHMEYCVFLQESGFAPVLLDFSKSVDFKDELLYVGHPHQRVKFF